MSVLDHAEGCPMDTEEKASGPLAGGIVNHGYQCGMLWGMTLAAGAKAYRIYGAGPKAETAALITAQKLVTSFRTCNKQNDINCMEIIGFGIQQKMTPGKLVKFIATGKLGGMVGCITTMSGKSAKAAYKDISVMLTAENHYDSAPGPVSCAALTAQKMGATPQHVAMAAGLAGGIGLSGGGCGALGTAIWLNEINAIKNSADKNAYNARANKIIDKYLKAADFEFECEKIVGRKFESAADHSDFVRGGGCAKIIESLAGSIA
jgi:hypothetical protein